MGGFDKTIWGQSYALESGFERTRPHKAVPGFFYQISMIKNPRTALLLLRTNPGAELYYVAKYIHSVYK